MTEKEKRKPRPPKEVTATLLREQALKYLDRFSVTTHKLKRHLLTKNRNSILLHQSDPEQIENMIDELIVRLEKNGILNDQSYANSKARSMARQGKSLRQIKGKLFVLGLNDDENRVAQQEIIENEGYSDRVGAAKYIRKRRFGPYKQDPPFAERREKELMALVRNGYDFDIANELLSLQSVEEIENIIYGS